MDTITAVERLPDDIDSQPVVQAALKLQPENVKLRLAMAG